MTTDELVDEIFGRCRERIERGERVDVDEVLRVHADLAEPLRERFAAVRLLDRAGARRGRDEAAATRIGASLGGYRLESVLGAGGMGTVYLATAERGSDAVAAGGRVALKVFHPHLVRRERFVARFRREADLGRRVRNANVVRTLGAGEADEGGSHLPFLVMEHVEGRTLRELLAESGRLPEELVRHVGREIANGLAAIHAAGAVHRDLKPENVIVTRDHVVKVMDLGVARVDDAATLSDSGAFVGSLRYGAPEQVSHGGPIDGRADLHALGLLLFELATDAPPFTGENFGEVIRQILDVRPRRIGELAPQVSPFLEELVAQLVEKDRERRPASAEAVASILADGESSAWWKERATAMRRETRRPLRRIRIPRDTELYGREAEITLLRSLYQRASEGDGQVAVVEGEAGIGKSRLVDEFVLSLWAAGEDIDFLYGSYPPGGAASAAGAFVTAYREHFGDDDDAVRDALPQTPLLVSAFAAFLRGDVPPEHAEKLTPGSLRTLFVHATRSFAAKRTTIVLIDDLHFAPEEGRALFTSLALAAPGHRILLIGGARPSLDAKWAATTARLPNVSRLPLPRLGAKDLVRLLKDALRSDHLATDLAGRIGEKSDGNPFFVFEILRGLREGNFLTKRPDGTWITTRSIREIDVPPSIVEVIQARVSDLDKDERDVLEVAACIGFEFDAGLAGQVLGAAPIPLLQRLGRIEKAHRLVRSVGRLFAFDHHQVQEVLYAGLSPPLREAYHAAIAETIEARSGAAARDPEDLDGALCVDLAEHFLKAGKGARALRYFEAALTLLKAGYRNEQAIALVTRALDVPGLLAGSERASALRKLAIPLDLLGRREAQRAATEESLALSRAAGDRHNEVKSATNLGVVLGALGRYAEAREQLQRSLDVAREAGERSEEARAARCLGEVLRHLGRYAEAREQQENCIVLERELGDVDGEAAATINLGCVSMALGRTAESREHNERGLRLAQTCGNRRWLAVATGNLGIVFYSLGRYADARGHLESYVSLAREIGDRVSEASGAEHLSSVSRCLGRLSDAREFAQRGLALAREIGHRGQEGSSLVALSAAESELGHADAAQRLRDESLDVWRSIGARGAEADALLGRGALLAREGRIGEARADLELALAIAREISLPCVQLGASAHLARLSGGDVPAALDALAAHETGVEVHVAMDARLVLWEATRDRAHLAEAKRLLDFLVEHAPPECREPMLANVRLHREIAAAARELGME